MRAEEGFSNAICMESVFNQLPSFMVVFVGAGVQLFCQLHFELVPALFTTRFLVFKRKRALVFTVNHEGHRK